MCELLAVHSDYRQGHAGDVTADAEWELPAGSSVSTSWLSLSCGQGISAAQAWASSGEL